MIGLSGPQRSGKTTVLDILCKNHRFHRMSIADQIKAHAHQLVGRAFTEAEKDAPQDFLNGKTPRDLYIMVGNMDDLVHNLWVNKMFRTQYEGADEFHVVESVGKMFQMVEIVRYCERARDGVVILDIRRPGFEYKDTRTPIQDTYPTLYLNNDAGIDKVVSELNELIANMPKLRHIRSFGDVQLIEKLEAAIRETVT